MTLCRWIRRALAVSLTALALGNVAQAGLLPVSVTVIPEADSFRWTYAIVLPTDSKLQAGNYFTIYDFKGYLPGGEFSPDGWSFTSAMVGPTPERLRPNDDTTESNLTWTYTGPTIPSGQIGLGNFWAISELGDTATDSYTARTNRTSDGLVDSNITETLVPAGSVGTNLVPEPTTLALAGLGLPLVGLLRLRRKKA